MSITVDYLKQMGVDVNSVEDVQRVCDDRLNALEEDAEKARASMLEYKEVFTTLTNHVTTVTTLDKEEYDGFLVAVQEFLDEAEMVENIFESDYEKNVVGRTLRHMMINAGFSTLNPKIEKVFEYITKIETRLEASDFRNPHFISLIQLVWKKFGDEIESFSYDNLEEQSGKQDPWLVIDVEPVVYIKSFPSKIEAQKYVMQHMGLNGKNIVCRY